MKARQLKNGNVVVKHGLFKKEIINPRTDDGACRLVDLGLIPASSAPMAILRRMQRNAS